MFIPSTNVSFNIVHVTGSASVEVETNEMKINILIFPLFLATVPCQALCEALSIGFSEQLF